MKTILRTIVLGGLAWATATMSSNPAKADEYDEGYQMGNVSAWNLVTSIERKTIDRSCRNLKKMDKALVSVTRNVRRPQTTRSSQTDEFVLGYYRGYLDAIRGGLEEGHWICDEKHFDRGDSVGEIYGAYLCSVAEVSIDYVTKLTLPSLYQEWSGGSRLVQTECRTSAEAELVSCGLNDREVSQLSLSVLTSCSDIR